MVIFKYSQPRLSLRAERSNLAFFAQKMKDASPPIIGGILVMTDRQFIEAFAITFVSIRADSWLTGIPIDTEKMHCSH
jgi:hypothetical protein